MEIKEVLALYHRTQSLLHKDNTEWIIRTANTDDYEIPARVDITEYYQAMCASGVLFFWDNVQDGVYDDY